MTEIKRTTTGAALDDILDEYAASGPSKETLEKWIAAYPQFQRELMEMTLTWLELKHLPPGPVVTDPVDIELKAASILGQVLHTLQNASSLFTVAESKQAPQQGAPALVDSLLQQAAKLGMDVKQIAATAHMSVAMVMSFNRRLVHAASVPRDAFSALGEALQLPWENLYAYLEMPLQAGPQQQFKAEQAPILQRIDFAELVKRDPELLEAERNRWLSVAMAAEKHARRKE